MDCQREQLWESAKKREGNGREIWNGWKVSTGSSASDSSGEPKGWDPADEGSQTPRNVYSPVRNSRCPKHELELRNGNCENIHTKVNLNTHLKPAGIRIFLIAVDPTRLQVFYLFSRTLFAKFMFFPSGKCKDKACTFTAAHLFVSFKLQVFRELIVLSGVWGGAQVIPMGFRHQSLGTLWCQKEALSPSCVTACPRQPGPCSGEWLVLAFSLSRVAELELFAL